MMLARASGLAALALVCATWCIAAPGAQVRPLQCLISTHGEIDVFENIYEGTPRF